MTIRRITLFLLAMIIALCSTAAAESETFRNGKVLDVTGSAVVARSSYEMPVYEQMMIQSGDQVETAADGWVVLCVDDDKYLILEPETKVLFELEGDARKGMIRIHLLQGAIYTEIENPLSDGDGYEITTADGVMAVRGTNFRASHETDDENRQRQTEIQLFFGELEVSTDGETPQTETLTGGEEIAVTTPLDEDGEPAGAPELGDKRPLDMDDLPEEYDHDELKESEALFGQEGDSQESAPVCGACGHEIIDEDDHAPVESLSKYCKEQHYRCTDMMHYCDPNHDYNPDKDGVQEGCGNAYGCKRSNAHTLCLMCGDMWCDYDNGGHETVCGNADHRPCQINQKGHYRKSEHELCPYGCGGYLCDGASHGTGSGQCSYIEIKCSYCGTVDVQHDAAPCGQHCTAQSGDHTECICGGWACAGTHGKMECGHYCKQSESGHEACPYGCGGYLCDGASHGTGKGQCGYVPPVTCSYCGTEGAQHSAAPCGVHCTEQNGEHELCPYGCGGYLCDGASHGTGSGQCSYIEIKCSYCGTVDVQHDAAPCGQHCTAQSGDHTECTCGGWACVGTHGKMECGHYCKQSESGHEACPYGCGGYLCDGASHGTGKGQCSYVPPVTCSYCGTVGVRHNAEACGVHCTAQSGDHTECICGGWACVGTHGKMECGHYCKQSESGHEACPYGCGGYLCDGASHGTGKGQCSYVPPVTCSYCGTVGVRHNAEACGVHCTAQSGGHELCPYDCGGWACVGDHTLRSCEHCQQASGTHEICGYCEEWLCYPGEIPHGPGEDQCGDSGFIPIPCFGCGEVGANHSTQFCNTHCEVQEGDHTKCGYCGEFKCLSTEAEHGDGVCNA